ncbi:NAD(P)H-hydrate dehydratase [Sphingomonas sp. ABOLE]|uniref:NAD(P)H-hydrate dehydratase n=1 Tax=Sphingomonas sp. ABOLE TaxID=1985878 RepID=UPI000F7E5E87|nr:NAD(P)H-hydrate dehydratase [Sphingomonas sp. ABOLE]RSV35567.1 NAD(P)H-hydrate dehydratase [Sphingomonas sp. ABOLE]
MIPPGAPILTADAMRAAEEAVFARGVSQDELMERAGAAVAREAVRFAMGRSVLVLAGPGNNGGDAYVVARHLREAGLDVLVAASGAPKQGAAERMHARWKGPTTSLYGAPVRPVVIDGLFGIGVTRSLERSIAAVLSELVRGAEFTLAIDLPSGMDTDSGDELGAPRGVNATVALGALKPAHVLGDGLSRCGHVLLADIGIPVESAWRSVARPQMETPGPRTHKYSRGLVAVVEGAMPGAGRLAARAAMASGAGYVMLAGPDPAGPAPDALVRRTIDDADDLADFLAGDRIDAVVLGPGLGRDRRAEAFLRAGLAVDKPLVLDGDALSLLGTSAAATLAAREAPVWITPHGGEFDRMFAGTGSKIDRTLQAAASGATVVHKGGDTVIAGPDGRVRVLAGASPWLSTAGTGDVLAGLLGAQIGQGGSGVDPAAAAVWLHGRAAQLAGPAFFADQLVAQLPEACSECL